MIKFTAPTLSDQALTEAGVTSQEILNVYGFMSELATADLKQGLSVSLEGPVNVDNPEDVYESVEFIVTSRFKKDGATWLAGDGFAINLDSALAMLSDASERISKR